MIQVNPRAVSSGSFVTVTGEIYSMLTAGSAEVVLFPQSLPWDMVVVATVQMQPWPEPTFISTTFQVPPSIPPGDCHLAVRLGSFGAPELDSTSFQVLPQAFLTFTPWFGPPGQAMTVQANGFAPNEEVDFWLLDQGGTQVSKLGQVKSDGSGSVPSGSYFSIPTAPTIPQNPYLLTAVGQASGRSSLPSHFYFALPLSAHPDYLGYPPTTPPLSLQAFVTGFQPNETVDCTLTDASGVVQRVGEGTIDNITEGHVTIDDHTTTPGQYTLTATGRSSGLTASNPFFVLGPPSLSSTSVKPGFPLTVTLTGCPPNARFQISLASVPQVTGQWTDSTGNAQVTFPAPAVPSPTACSAASESPPPWGTWATRTPLGALTLLPLPPISLSPTSGKPGTNFTVSGGPGFPPNAAFDLTIGGKQVGSGTTDPSSGSITASGIALAPPGGAYPVEVTGVTGQPFPWNQSATFNTTPLPTPTLSTNSAPAGSVVSFSAAGYPPSTTGQSLNFSLYMASVMVASGTTDSLGNLSGSFTVPSSLSPGSYPLHWNFSLALGSQSVSWIDSSSFDISLGAVDIICSFSLDTVMASEGSTLDVPFQGKLQTASGPVGATTFSVTAHLAIPITGGKQTVSTTVPGLCPGSWTVSAGPTILSSQVMCSSVPAPGWVQLSVASGDPPCGSGAL